MKIQRDKLFAIIEDREGKWSVIQNGNTLVDKGSIEDINELTLGDDPEV